LLDKGVNVSGYRIDGVLGVGGMGVVYEATQLSLERTVALKLISSELGSDDAFRERFRREGQIQAAIDHPHIVPVYEAGESDYGLFIAMRLIRGRNLKDLIVGNELTPQRTTHLLTQVAEALDSAHEVGLIHRDIKPYNILVDDRRDHAYLADFGVTKARSRPNLTKTGQMVGTLDYMAPEQIRGQSATEQTDIYALGCVLYECFTGTVPFYRETDAAVLYAHLSEPLPSVRDHRDDLPPDLDSVLTRAMAKKPEERYASATGLLLDTSRAVAQRAAPPVAPAPATDVPGAPATVATGPSTPTVAPEPAQETATPAAAETALAASATAATPSETPATEVPAGSETVLAGDTPPPGSEIPAAPETVLAGATEAPIQEDEAVSDPGTPAAPETVLAGEAAAIEAPAPTDPNGAGAVAAPEAEVVEEWVQTGPTATEPTTAATAAVAATAAEPATVGAPPERRLSTGVVAGGLVALAVVLALVGFFVGHATGKSSSKASADSGTLSAGKATITYPGDWEPTQSLPSIPGVTAANAKAVAPKGSTSAGLAVGSVAQNWPTFLPKTLLSHITQADVDDRTVVRIGSLQAFRYANLHPTGFAGVMTLYAVPQPSAPTIAMSCYATSGGIPSTCASIAAGVKVSGAKPYALTPSSEYVHTLNSSLASVNAARSSGLKKLNAAGSAKAQSQAAKSIASAYEKAAGSMQRSDVTAYVKPVNDPLVASLRSAGSAYTALASAATAGSSARYNAAKSRATRSAKAVDAAVQQFRLIGFDVR
jgi:predicted Ser/Thr protein kinase